MNTEIEKKFLVKDSVWKNISETIEKSKPTKQIFQSYIAVEGKTVTRVRITDGKKAELCIKSKCLYSRDEFEYEIPLVDGLALSEYAVLQPIYKSRHYIDYEGHTFEVDEFSGSNEGLVLAELELEDVDESYEVPEWIGQDVTSYIQYYNLYLAENPYKQWKK